MLYLNIILLTFSLLGLILISKNILEIPFEFTFVFVLTSIITIISVLAYINLLFISNAVIISLGILSLIYLVFKSNLLKDIKELFINFGFIMTLFIIILFSIALSGQKLLHHDNFTHWALVVKDMYIFDRISDINSIVSYRSYPLGSSYLLYFASKSLGFREDILLITQFIFSISCLLPVAVNVKNKWLYIPLIFTFMVLISINLFIFNLLVDLLLGLLGLAISVIIFYYKDNIKKACIIILPMIISIIQVKTSGALFFAIGVFLLLYFLFTYSKDKQSKKEGLVYIIITMGICLIFLFAWSIHRDMITSSNSSGVLGEFYYKGITSSINLVKSFAIRTLQFKMSPMIHMIYINSILIVIMIALKLLRIKIKNVVLFTIFLDVIFGFYMIGLASMYVFSMPMRDASKLASYDRYCVTILIYLIGLLIYYVLNIYSENDKLSQNKFSKSASLLSLFIFFYFICKITGSYGNLLAIPPYRDNDYTSEPRYKEFVAITQENFEGYDENRYAVYIDLGDDVDLYTKFFEYKLFTKNLKLIDSETNFDDISVDFDRIIVLTDDDYIRSYLDQVDEDSKITGVYNTKEFIQ